MEENVCVGKRSERRKFCVVLSIQLPETGPRTPEAREGPGTALKVSPHTGRL